MYLFVLSPPFSGSTILHDLIATSPNVSILPKEGQHLEGASEHMRGSHWNPKMEVPWKKIEKVWNQNWKEDGPIFLEKSPPNILRADAIESHFSPTSFVLTIRDPYAFAEGMRRRNNNLGVVRGAKLWKRIARAQRRNQKNLKNTTFFRYREFTETTREVVKKILDLVPELEKMASSQVVGWSSMRREMNIRNLNPTQIRRLSGRDIHRINHILREDPELMEAFGYKFISPSVVRSIDSLLARAESSLLEIARFRGWARR